MNTPDSARPIPLLLSEQLDPLWIEARAAEIAAWSESPHKRWTMASHTIAWAIAEKSYDRMDTGFAALHELVSEPEYDITLVPYRGAKMVIAYERAIRQRIEPEPMDREAMGTTYRNWVAVGQEIGNAEFKKDGGRAHSALSEVVALGVHMRAKKSHHFPYLALPREESSANSFVNHDGYMLRTSKGGSLKKAAWAVTSNASHNRGMHPDVKELPVLEIVSGVIKRFPEVVRPFRYMRNAKAEKLAKLRMVVNLLEKDARGELQGVDRQVLHEITGGLLALSKEGKYTSTTPGGGHPESSLARQLREKFSGIDSQN